jgi:hypothetical protein
LYINVDYIGDFYEENDYIPRVLYTKVEVLTNKEGFKVKETPNEIMVKLSKINLLTIING